MYIADELPSTNDAARELGASGEMAAVVARRQIAGHGRHDREWWSESPRGLYMSVANEMTMDDRLVPMVSIAAAVAALVSIREAAGGAGRFAIKWPNDIVSPGGKVCGVISEAVWSERAPFAVTGFGVNVAQRACEIPQGLRASSIYIESGRDIDVIEFAERLLSAFDRCIDLLRDGRSGELLADYSSACATIGRDVSITSDGREIFAGRARGLGEHGELIVDDGRVDIRTFCYGEVSSRALDHISTGGEIAWKKAR